MDLLFSYNAQLHFTTRVFIYSFGRRNNLLEADFECTLALPSYWILLYSHNTAAPEMPVTILVLEVGVLLENH